MEKIDIALVMGDGSAPEMMREACRVVQAAARMAGVKIRFIKTPMGWAAYKIYGDTLPKESLEKALKIGKIFFGGVGDPELDDTIGAKRPDMKPESKVLLALRQYLELLLNYRPMIYYGELAHLVQVRPERIPEEGITQVYIRFLLQDSYFGIQDLWDLIPEEIRKKLGIKRKEDITGDEDIVTDIAYYRRSTVEKYFRAAFAYARSMNMPLTVVGKWNIMPRYLFWKFIAERIQKQEFPDVQTSFVLVDASNALLFEPLKLKGVIAMGNEQGDIVSDGAAGACGGLGLMHSTAVNPDTGAIMAESGAGTAPTLAGQDKANPIGRILAGADLLRHLGYAPSALAIEQAVRKVLQDGWCTADIFTVGIDDPAKLLGTKGMGAKILSYLKKEEV